MNKIKMVDDVIYNQYVLTDMVILHLSDIHFNINISLRRMLALGNKINDTLAQYVLITGDIIDDANIIHNEEKIGELFQFFRMIAKGKKIIIAYGNHDMHGDNTSFFNKLKSIENIYVLDNEIYVDNKICISGFTLPRWYYYNDSGKESVSVFMDYMSKHKELISNLPKNKLKVALIHSPVNLVNDEIINCLGDYDLILCGHTHAGMVPRFLYWLIRGNRGIISPYKKFFPKVAKGKIINEKENLTIIISGGITKLSLYSAKKLSKFNFVYDAEINRILVTRKEEK